MVHSVDALATIFNLHTLYRVIQEETSIFWQVRISVIVINFISRMVPEIQLFKSTNKIERHR